MDNCIIIIFNSASMVKAGMTCIRLTPDPLLESHINVTSTLSLILPLLSPFFIFFKYIIYTQDETNSKHCFTVCSNPTDKYRCTWEAIVRSLL